jgi:hypothetical protein
MYDCMSFSLLYHTLLYSILSTVTAAASEMETWDLAVTASAFFMERAQKGKMDQPGVEPGTPRYHAMLQEVL